MCGIAGYIGPKNAVDVVFDQLKRLEYRGYDSAGIAYLEGNAIKVTKKAGKLSELGKALFETPKQADLAIAHSRWATHGGPTDENAHPHYDRFERIAIIHNGIIENYLELKQDLLADAHKFHSQTDTEVAAHVIGREYVDGVPLEEAVRRAIRKLRGAYALVVMSQSEPEKIVCVRNSSPLVLGIGEGENMLASDIPALLPYTREVIVMEENMIAVLTKDKIRLIDSDGKDLPLQPMHVDWDVASAERGGYEHFMLKEIHEQPQVMRQVTAGRIDEKLRVRLEGIFGDHVWTEIDRVNIIACGTAYHAGLMGKHLFESALRLPTDVYFSSEFRYGDPVLSPKSLAIFVSQSGETLDSLAALRLCKQRRIRTLGIVNVVGSAISRECDRTIYTQAGPEISVASTKAYTAQVMVFALLALYIAQVQEVPGVKVDEWVSEILRMDELAEECLKLEEKVEALADECKDMPLCFFLGRGADAFVAMEGALKLKEIAYVPTQEYPAGEMKHGPLALVTDQVVSIFAATDPTIRDKVVSNVKEVQARGGKIIAITTAEDTLMEQVAEHVVKIPKTKFDFLNALLAIIPLQLFAYHLAKIKGCEIDQPRNLAKSVTVE
ncbi:MAG: glutamine--fructose-6-phosphate transaminase (isomerizing) [Armatimonadetes bacterium]|nr:glutamine--fructose-6-phosphate transaminase (isomerizing) [Armatimonadota bacterium]MBS1703247.1 glutamine--fructose-6-phosphate transaminase (isomerizing) [Armatimonadota bacterium]MBS1725181.1 glutamine--fructose-6-phosphate transaminase (isomerizing) [Armatimonadota bacterium]